MVKPVGKVAAGKTKTAADNEDSFLEPDRDHSHDSGDINVP